MLLFLDRLHLHLLRNVFEDLLALTPGREARPAAGHAGLLLLAVFTQQVRCYFGLASGRVLLGQRLH